MAHTGTPSVTALNRRLLSHCARLTRARAIPYAIIKMPLAVGHTEYVTRHAGMAGQLVWHTTHYQFIIIVGDMLR